MIERFSPAAFIPLPFAAYALALWLAARPTEAHWQRADPILLLFGRSATLAFIWVAAISAAALWWRAFRPGRVQWRLAARDAALGLAAAAAVTLALRGVAGPTLPAFVPAEESAHPGAVLNLAAGIAEEVLFRLALLPALFLLASRQVPKGAAAVGAIALTGLAFALVHGTDVSAPWFWTRFLFPGCAMSAAALLLSPSFVVAAHCAAHVAIPLLFTS